jgi:SAM-dependent methyltransferase
MIKLNDSLDYIGDELELFKNASNWKKYFCTKIGRFIQGEVLEVGSGIGINTKYLFNASVNVTSWSLVEPDPTLANQIEANTENLNIPNKEIINGTINSVTDKKFDTIIYIDVLEHIEESRKEIELIKTHLKPNGHAIILVPAFNFMYNDFDKRIGHFRRYNKKLLKNELNSQMSILKLFYLDSVGFFASLLNKYILKKELPSIKNIWVWDKIMIPLSKISDILFFRSFGKSLIGIFKND